jgi:hypothetical protein
MLRRRVDSAKILAKKKPTPSINAEDEHVVDVFGVARQKKRLTFPGHSHVLKQPYNIIDGKRHYHPPIFYGNL